MADLDNASCLFEAMDEWLTTPAGMSLSLAISEQVNGVLNKLQGVDLLSLGFAPEKFQLQCPNFRYKHVATVTSTIENSSVIVDMSKLPFSKNSLDCVFAPLTLELCQNNLFTLEEIDRITASMGYVLFVGFNPISLWGAPLLLGKSALPIAKRKHKTAYRLRNELTKLGYQCLHLSSFYYIPPLKSEKNIKKFAFLNEVGKMLWPFPAGFYLLLAQKVEANFISPLLQEQQSGLVLSQNVI